MAKTVSEKEEEGIGFHDISSFNQALLHGSKQASKHLFCSSTFIYFIKLKDNILICILRYETWWYLNQHPLTETVIYMQTKNTNSLTVSHWLQTLLVFFNSLYRTQDQISKTVKIAKWGIPVMIKVRLSIAHEQNQIWNSINFMDL